MMGRHNVLILFAFLVEGVFGDAAEVKSVNDGDPVLLTTGVLKKKNETVWWYFNDTLIATIDGICCLYDGKHGIFRDRLMLDCKTGSLIITDIKAAHTGLYEAKIKSEDTSGKIEKCESTKIIQKNDNHGETVKLSSLTVSASDFGKNNNENQIDPQDKEKISSGPSSDVSALVAGIVGGGVVVLLLAVAVAVVFGVVKFTHCSIFDMKKIKQVPENKPCLPAQNGSV